MQEISREDYLALSGHKPTAELPPIYAKRAEAFSPDALALSRESFVGAVPGSEEQRSTRLMLDWLAESQSSRELAPLDERAIAWETSAVIRLPDGRGIQYESASIQIA